MNLKNKNNIVIIVIKPNPFSAYTNMLRVKENGKYL